MLFELSNFQYQFNVCTVMQVREETSHEDHQNNSGEPFFCLITFSAISMTLRLLLLSVVYLFFFQINRLCGAKILSLEFMLPLLVSLISWLRSLIVHRLLYDFTHSNLMLVLDQPSTESSLQLPEKRILELILDILQRWVLFHFIVTFFTMNYVYLKLQQFKKLSSTLLMNSS